ncbi:uncharacterized protein PHALS_11235 [Plasmopara halstedii]|uniref:Uncharacterized protein n=1 Tax=Plasmopara halstedii TaxID=4781 RepID=A0A0P1AID2_PLAHL|nr:uncharacterized protein PHALS_11235 [Plasmopara halstedii]CEG41066.1 hypothetical protein PHALS_11235 [Plasmopara halstedii]|eukprot:XP_024577435.1 hypothetical protein PHALS_11235 [Plasmopara halstedii]
MGHMSRVHAPPIGILKPFKVCSSTLNGFIRQDTILLVGFEIGAAGTIHSASTLQLS